MDNEIGKELLNNFMVNIFQAQIDNNFAYLLIDVRREEIIQDTLNTLIREDINFKKPLRIKFQDELGVDEGGV